jgi:general stress protein 26
MDKSEVLRRVKSVISETRYSVMSTVDSDNRPQSRWMSSTLVSGDLGRLYCLAHPSSDKVKQLKKNNRAQWMFHRVNFNEVVWLDGVMNVLNSPSVKQQVFEKVADRALVYFKKFGKDPDFVVLELAVESVRYQQPTDDVDVTVKIGEGK